MSSSQFLPRNANCVYLDANFGYSTPDGLPILIGRRGDLGPIVHRLRGPWPMVIAETKPLIVVSHKQGPGNPSLGREIANKALVRKCKTFAPPPGLIKAKEIESSGSGAVNA